MNFKLPIELIILGTILILWGIFMLSIHYRYKKRMKEIEKEWEDGRIRQERRTRQWIINTHTQLGYPSDEVRPKTDKLSPHKKVVKHTMR